MSSSSDRDEIMRAATVSIRILRKLGHNYSKIDTSTLDHTENIAAAVMVLQMFKYVNVKTKTKT